jgi:hypothetical protein
MVSDNQYKNHKILKNTLSTTEEVYMSLDQCIETAAAKEFYSIASLIRSHPQKKQKVKDVKPIAFARLNSRLGKAKPITLKCLLDSGASGSLIAAKHATKLRKKTNKRYKDRVDNPSRDNVHHTQMPMHISLTRIPSGPSS